MIGWEGVATCYDRRGLGWVNGKMSSSKGLSSTGRLSRRGVKSPSLEVLKRYLEVALRDML